jgi:HPt (histidine-containing phosphotransfer) domain-containing protein
VIALTASSDKEKELKCIDAGMNAFLAKPFTEQKLFEIINKVLAGLPSQKKNDITASLDELSKMANGDPNFIKEMARLFIKGANESMEVIKTAYEKNDWTSIKEATHKIAPSCRHLGALKMLELVKLIERQVENNPQKTHIRILIHELETESSATIDEVKKYLS